MSEDKIQTRVTDDLPKFKDVIASVPALPSVLMEHKITNAENPAEIHEMVLAEIPKDALLELLVKKE